MAVDAVPTPENTSNDEVPAGFRRCIVSGRVLERERLIRFVLDSQQGVIPDVEERLPGRGLWVAAERAALETAIRRKIFSRAARCGTQVPEDLCASVERLLLRRCQSLIGLAIRAGQAAFGYEKVREWLRAGNGRLLIEASDGAPGECRKLRSLAFGLPVLRTLTAKELAASAGRGRTVHGVIASDPLAAKLSRDAARLAGIRAAAEEIEPVRPARAVHPT